MQTIGRYQLQEKLGQGGMGIVYRAFDTLIERVVAIKVISSPADLTPEARERFFREARAAGQLSHKNIITIHDLGEVDGQPYLAMEFLEGEDLQRRLHRPDKMGLGRKLDLAIEICDGLEFAHARGVVHRDVKPANIFITDRGTVKILDFGLARLMSSQLTNTNMLMGTVNYMAPEQVRGERADQRSDVFSVGVVLYELLSGRKAFEGDSFASTLYKILQEVPEPLWKIDATLPRELIAIVERALAKPKDERYQSMSELKADLAAYRHQFVLELGGTRPPSGSTTVSDLPATRPPSGGLGSGGAAVRPSTDSARAASAGSGQGAPPGSGAANVPPGSGQAPVSGSGAPGSGTASWAGADRTRRAVLPVLIVLAIAAITGAVWIVRHRSSTPPAPASSSASVPPPVATDPMADLMRQAEQALQGSDYPAAQRYAEMVLKQQPQQAEARRIRDTARDHIIEASLQHARDAFDAGDFTAASRAAGDVLAIAPENADARRIMDQAGARIRGRGADEARQHMIEARSAAQAARASSLAPAAYRTALRTEQEAQRLFKSGRLAEAATRFYEASGLYRSAETTARSEAAAVSQRAAQQQTPPAAPTPAPPQRETAPVPEPEKPQPSTAQPQQSSLPQTAPAQTQPPQAPPVQQQPPAPSPPPPSGGEQQQPAAVPSAPPIRSAPVPTTTPDLPSRSPSADEKVNEVLGRYKGALEARSLEDLKRIWPSLSGASQDRIRDEFRHANQISVEIADAHVQVSGATATATFLRRYDIQTVEGQRLHSESQCVMELRRNGNNWVIERIRFTPLR
jgi:eukaryotic-like serine/threonine-protein kinase